MDTKVYYDRKNPGLLVTSNFDKYQKQIDLGLFPNTDLSEMSISDIEKHDLSSVTFDEVEDLFYNDLKAVLSKLKLKEIAFHNSNINLSDVELNVQHLIIGEKSKLDFSERNFKHLEEITFLSGKTFKGKLSGQMESVKKLTLWYENRKTSDILSLFPALKDLTINNGSIVELTLSGNPAIETVYLNRCTKLEKIILNPGQYLKKIQADGCKKLDTSNLGDNVFVY